MSRRRRTREHRRALVAELLAEQPALSVRDVARRVGCGVGTAFRDIQAIRAEWGERRLSAYEDKLSDDFARTDRLIAILWPQAVSGDYRAIDRLLAVLHYRARVLGVYDRHETSSGIVAGQIVVKWANELDDEARGELQAGE
jgi:AcrR family transcriptional regulator